jgi:malonyl-CoA/methylmalonyl-CoA synthetase
MTQQDHNLYSGFRQHFPSDLNQPLMETDEGVIYCYGDAEQESSRLAGFMVSLGLKPGDRVTVQVPKSPTALWLYLACLRAGLVFHPLNSAYQRSELEYFLSNAAPSLVVCGSDAENTMSELVAEQGIPVLTLDADGQGSLTERSANYPADFDTVARAADDLAALLYSSGTTGRPKGIMLTHENLAANAQTLVEAWGFSADDCLLHALPIFHVHGLFVALGCVLMSGARMRWLPSFNSKAVMAALPDCTVMMGVPTYYTRLLEDAQFGREDCRSLRLAISGSAPLLVEVFNAFRERTGHTILERYGMTETNMNTSNPLEGERKAGTVGLPLPGVEVRIADVQNQPLPIGEIGNLQVRGRNVFKGYWGMPEKTAEDFTEDGFFNTGDKGRVDEDGYVAIVGRAKDMIISGGLNVYPKEIEAFIDDLDGVSESAVIGVAHADFGEAVVAVVVPQSGCSAEPAQLIDAVKQNLANFKVPKKVFYVDELPRNTMGKVQKNVLRECYADCLSGGSH